MQGTKYGGLIPSMIVTDEKIYKIINKKVRVSRNWKKLSVKDGFFPDKKKATCVEDEVNPPDMSWAFTLDLKKGSESTKS